MINPQKLLKRLKVPKPQPLATDQAPKPKKPVDVKSLVDPKTGIIE